MVMVIRALAAHCPAGYSPGDRFPLDLYDPENSFRCNGAYEALEPFIEQLQKGPGGELPACQYVGSCECPLTDAEAVFYLYTNPAVLEVDT
jgi:uncharacterized repeat protein (TIGR04076 family)